MRWPGARAELAADFVEDLRHVDALLRETRKKLATASIAAATSLTEMFGVGPVIAATVTGDVRDVSRFRGRDHFAAYNGTAPIEVSSGHRKVYRLSMRGNRRLNHAIHMAAITQIRNRHSDGRAYYDKKLAEGKTPKDALRALKRQISNAIFACLQADARRAAARAKGPGGQPGNDSVASAAGSHPRPGSSDKPLPGPVTTLRPRPASAGQGSAFLGRCHQAAGAAAGPGGAPAVKRGRTTWRLRQDDGRTRLRGRPGDKVRRRSNRIRHTSRPRKDRPNLLTQRLRSGRLLAG